jgi:hypothetical protein
MVTTSAVCRDQRRHQTISQTTFGLLIAFGHRHDHFASRKCITLTRIISATHRPPINACWISIGRVSVSCPTLDINYGKLTLVAAVIIFEKQPEYFLGTVTNLGFIVDFRKI